MGGTILDKFQVVRPVSYASTHKDGVALVVVMYIMVNGKGCVAYFPYHCIISYFELLHLLQLDCPQSYLFSFITGPQCMLRSVAPRRTEPLLDQEWKDSYVSHI